MYRAPTLAATDWHSESKIPPLRRAIGVDLDQSVVYALDVKNEVVAVDLSNGKVRTLLAGVRDAALGPDGALYTVDDSNAVTQTIRRNPLRFRTRLPGRPLDLFGTKDDQLLAVTAAASNTLTLLASDQPPATALLPHGDAAATFWGDLLAIAADTAVVLYDPHARDKSHSIPVSGHARAVVFSPSGHRLYVARREGNIMIINRFTLEPIGEFPLPGPAGAMRPDPFGRWLLVHPPSADSVWVLDLAAGRVAGSLATEWSKDLHTVTNRQTLLVKQKDDIVAYDLARPEMPEIGRIPDGAADLWLSLAWTPETGTAMSAPAESTVTAVPSDSGQQSGVFLQVSSSQNPVWAAELAKQLSEAGLPASVLKPRTGEEGYRVVLGPYATRDEAEATGRKLGRPFFIYQPDPHP